MRSRFPAVPNDPSSRKRHRPAGRGATSAALAALVGCALASCVGRAAGGVPDQGFDCVMDPSRTVKVGSPVTGVLSEVLVSRGNPVTHGQVIARIESSLEAATEKLDRFRAESNARIEAQTARLALARARLGRAAQLIGKNIVTQDKYEEIGMDVSVAEQDLLREKQDRQLAQLELERAQAAVGERTIRSPIDGIVSEEHLSAGEFTEQDRFIVKLARLDPLHVEVFLPVVLYNQMKVGTVATVHPDEPIGGAYPASVIVVDKVFDPASGTFGVRLALPNPDNRLPGGQRCKVTFPGVVDGKTASHG